MQVKSKENVGYKRKTGNQPPYPPPPPPVQRALKSPNPLGLKVPYSEMRVVSTMIPVTRYGSMLEAGRLSSR